MADSYYSLFDHIFPQYQMYFIIQELESLVWVHEEKINPGLGSSIMVSVSWSLPEALAVL